MGSLDTQVASNNIVPPFTIKGQMSGSVLITGALGFLGSVVLESILRNCPKVHSEALTHRHSHSQNRIRRQCHSA